MKKYAFDGHCCNCNTCFQSRINHGSRFLIDAVICKQSHLELKRL
jgi:hypothetical protein